MWGAWLYWRLSGPRCIAPLHPFSHFCCCFLDLKNVPLEVQDQTIHPQHSPHRGEQLAWGWVGRPGQGRKWASGGQGESHFSSEVSSPASQVATSKPEALTSVPIWAACHTLDSPRPLAEAPSAHSIPGWTPGLIVKGPGRLSAECGRVLPMK